MLAVMEKYFIYLFLSRSHLLLSILFQLLLQSSRPQNSGIPVYQVWEFERFIMYASFETQLGLSIMSTAGFQVMVAWSTLSETVRKMLLSLSGIKLSGYQQKVYLRYLSPLSLDIASTISWLWFTSCQSRRHISYPSFQFSEFLCLPSWQFIWAVTMFKFSLILSSMSLDLWLCFLHTKTQIHPLCMEMKPTSSFKCFLIWIWGLRFFALAYVHMFLSPFNLPVPINLLSPFPTPSSFLSVCSGNL